ncbi:MAG: carbohydrate kinase family protein [Microbacteriaceae bacterium]
MSSQGPDVLAIGEALIDVVHHDGEDHAHPGGSPLNVAIGASRLGLHAALSTRFADDEYGELISRHTADSDVWLTSRSIDADRTSTATATIQSDGSAQYVFDIDWDWTDDIDFVPKAVHTGSIGAVLQPGGANVLATIERLRPDCIVSYDPNARPALMGDRAEAVKIVEQYVRLADIIKASDEDVEWLYPDRSLEDTARAWAVMGPALVIVTRGGEGAVVVTSDDSMSYHVAPRVTVEDTIGAGDSFMAALLASMSLRGLLTVEKRGALHMLDDATVTKLINDALQCAAITVTRQGANPPSTADITVGQ